MDVKWGMSRQMDLSWAFLSYALPLSHEQAHPRNHTIIFVKCRPVGSGTDLAVSLYTGMMPQAGLAYIFCQGFLCWLTALS